MRLDSITIEDIKKMSKPHGLDSEGKRTIIETDRFVLSIVGGPKGFYGDFEETFEVAIIDKNTKEFVTTLFEPDATDDVIGYVTPPKVVEIANYFIRKSSKLI